MKKNNNNNQKQTQFGFVRGNVRVGVLALEDLGNHSYEDVFFHDNFFLLSLFLSMKCDSFKFVTAGS